MRFWGWWGASAKPACRGTGHPTGLRPSLLWARSSLFFYCIGHPSQTKWVCAGWICIATRVQKSVSANIDLVLRKCPRKILVFLIPYSDCVFLNQLVRIFSCLWESFSILDCEYHHCLYTNTSWYNYNSVPVDSAIGVYTSSAQDFVGWLCLIFRKSSHTPGRVY